jgi:DNA-binding NarL/FixJ family response regulator
MKVQRIKDVIIKEENGLQLRLKKLSDKEQEIEQLILLGKSNKEICAELFIEQSTLKTHINHIYKKLEIHSRKELKAIIK